MNLNGIKNGKSSLWYHFRLVQDEKLFINQMVMVQRDTEKLIKQSSLLENYNNCCYCRILLIIDNLAPQNLSILIKIEERGLFQLVLFL